MKIIIGGVQKLPLFTLLSSFRGKNLILIILDWTIVLIFKLK